MKKSILAIAVFATMSMGTATVAHASEVKAEADQPLVFEIDGASPMNQAEITDTRGEAVLKAGIKCRWFICKPYIYTEFVNKTYWKNGKKHTYTRSH